MVKIYGLFSTFLVLLAPGGGPGSRGKTICGKVPMPATDCPSRCDINSGSL